MIVSAITVYYLNHVGYKECLAKLQNEIVTRIIWTMWDIKFGKGRGRRKRMLEYYLNHVGYKEAGMSQALLRKAL